LYNTPPVTVYNGYAGLRLHLLSLLKLRKLTIYHSALNILACQCLKECVNYCVSVDLWSQASISLIIVCFRIFYVLHNRPLPQNTHVLVNKLLNIWAHGRRSSVYVLNRTPVISELWFGQEWEGILLELLCSSSIV